MTNPERSDGKKGPDKMRAYFRKHPLKRLSVLGFQATVFLRPELREYDNRLGLLEDSIIGNPLCFPIDETYTANKSTNGGEWLGYDFWRPTVLPVRKDGYPHSRLFEGKLAAFILDEVKDNPASQRTPMSTLKLYRFDHVLSIDMPKIETLVDLEFIRPTTYRDAYRRVGVYESYAADLDAKGVTDDKVYQVTPKGNTLVYLVQPSGKPEPKTQQSPQTSVLPGMLPSPVANSTALLY